MRAGRGDYRKRDDWSRQFGSGGDAGLIAAIADGEIAAGATGNAFLADSAFAATTKSREVTNDSGVAVPTGTKLLIGRVRPLPGLRIVQAFICTE